MNLDVDALAQEIRRVDGNHSLGAGQLAEALMPFFRALPHAGKVSEAETILREELRFYSSTEHGSLDGIPFKHVAHVLRVMLHRLSEAALSSQQAEALPVTWRYDIQYGPDGEENYAWVYDEHNNLVCTAKTHHAIAIVQRASPPVPADAGEPTVKALLAALKPFADIANEYSDQEDDDYQVWKDFDVIGASLPLRHFRAARSALIPTTSPAKEGE